MKLLLTVFIALFMWGCQHTHHHHHNKHRKCWKKQCKKQGKSCSHHSKADETSSPDSTGDTKAKENETPAKAKDSK